MAVPNVFVPGTNWKPPTQQQVASYKASDPTYSALAAAGLAQNNANFNAYQRTIHSTPTTGYKPPVVPTALRGGSTGGSSRSRGGGGGGAVAPPTYNQGQVDWLTQLLARSKPGQETATTLDLPDWQGQFDPTMYNQLEGQFNTAVGQDRAAANQAYQQLNQYLTSNYQNAFQNPNTAYATQAPGQDTAAMGRMLQSQGVDPSVMAAQQQGAAAGNAAFGNLWKLLGANEDTAQANRLRRAQIDAGTTNRALDVAALQGQTGIGLQRSQAQAAWQQQADQARNQIAQQEAMANWQRANQVADTNVASRNSYTNAQMQALLQFLPELKGSNLTMPDLNTLLGAA